MPDGRARIVATPGEGGRRTIKRAVVLLAPQFDLVVLYGEHPGRVGSGLVAWLALIWGPPSAEEDTRGGGQTSTTWVPALGLALPPH